MAVTFTRRLRALFASPDDPRRWVMSWALHTTIMTGYIALSSALSWLVDPLVR
jgi:hypothetical protein